MIKQEKEKIILIALLVLLPISFVIALLSLSDSFNFIWPSTDSITQAAHDLQKAQADLELKITHLEKRRVSRKKIMTEALSFWISSRDGQIETDLLKNIETIARTSNVNINHIGNNKISKVNEFFSYYDFTLDVQGSVEDIARFIVEIYKTRPKLHWTRCILRPLRLNDSRHLTLNGAMRVIIIDDNKVAAKIIEGSQE